MRIWLVGLAVAIAAMACGGESGARDETPNSVEPSTSVTPRTNTGGDASAEGTVVSDAFRAAAELAAVGAQIVLADLPAGWTGTPPYEETPGDGGDGTLSRTFGGAFGLSGECLEWSLRTESFPGSFIERASDEFSRDTEETVSSDVGVYATVALATVASDAHAALFDACGSQLEQLMRAIPDAEYGEGSTTATLAVLPPIAGTEWSHSFRMTMEIPSIGLTTELEYHALRHGRVMAGIGWTNTNRAFDAALGASLVATFSDRIRAADAGLVE